LRLSRDFEVRDRRAVQELALTQGVILRDKIDGSKLLGIPYIKLPISKSGKFQIT
jgi:hypothetical protein